jgi:hypothetical protein
MNAGCHGWLSKVPVSGRGDFWLINGLQMNDQWSMSKSLSLVSLGKILDSNTSRQMKSTKMM